MRNIFFLLLLLCAGAFGDTNSLADKSTGQVITASYFNEIYDALSGTVVPRDSAGTPTTGGGDLGSTTYRWGGLWSGTGNFSGTLTLADGSISSTVWNPATAAVRIGPSAGFSSNAGNTNGVNPTHGIRSTTNNAEVSWALEVLEGSGNPRGKFFLNDQATEWGFAATASSTIPTFHIYAGSTSLFSVTPAGAITHPGTLSQVGNVTFSAAAAADQTLLRSVTDGVLSVGGSSAVGTGSLMKLYGSAHATKADFVEFYDNGSRTAYWDGANSWVFGKDTSSTDYFRGAGLILNFQGSAASQTSITQDLNTGNILYGGGASTTAGGIAKHYGSTHATKPSWVEIIKDTTVVAYSDGAKWQTPLGLITGGNTTGDSNLGTISSVTLSKYYEGSFSITFTGAFTVDQTVTARYRKWGKSITIEIPSIVAACTVGASISSTQALSTIGSEFDPRSSFSQTMIAQNNSVNISGAWARVQQGNTLNVFRDATGTNFTTTGNCGWPYALVLSYITN